jgi:hypothetical protein
MDEVRLLAGRTQDDPTAQAVLHHSKVRDIIVQPYRKLSSLRLCGSIPFGA